MSHDTQRRDPLDTASAPAGYQPRNCIQVDPEMRFNPYILRKAVYLPSLTVPVNRRGPGGRWREYGILLGLWLLVMLVATVVIFRGMDLAAETGRRADRAGAEPAKRRRRRPGWQQTTTRSMSLCLFCRRSQRPLWRHRPTGPDRRWPGHAPHGARGRDGFVVRLRAAAVGNAALQGRGVMTVERCLGGAPSDGSLFQNGTGVTELNSKRYSGDVPVSEDQSAFHAVRRAGYMVAGTARALACFLRCCP